MKKWVILTIYASTLLAEEIPLSEQEAKHEIENFAKSLPDTEAPKETASKLNIILNTDSPSIPPQKAATLLETSPQEIQPVPFDPEDELSALEEEEREVEAAVKSNGILIDLGQVFAASPTIYTLLFILSIGSLSIWAYALMNLREKQLIPAESLREIREKLSQKQYGEALLVCENNPSVLFKMVATGIQTRHQGQNIMLDLMKAEGRRATTTFWQKLALLNDIAVIAPMLGLLGTVLGMFYAFYDLNRSMESITALFDGLGVSVGTTLCGLIVAILALTFHSISKYRLTRQLVRVENEAQSLANLIES